MTIEQIDSIAWKIVESISWIIPMIPIFFMFNSFINDDKDKNK